MHGVELVDLRVLDGPEEVHPILHDRAAQGTTELMPAIRGFLGLEWLEGVQRLVAEILEGVSGKSVAARLGHDLDDAAGREAELRGRLDVADLEFLHRILRQILARLSVFVPVVDHPVDDVAGAVERHRAADVDGGEKRSCRVQAGARHQQRERQILTRVDRQRLHLDRRDDAGDLGLRGVDHRRLPRDRHRLRERLNSHREVLFQDQVDGDREIFRGLRSESGELASDRIRARRQRRKSVVAVGAGHGRAGDAGLLIPHRDRDAGQHAALFVLDRAFDLTVATLRQQRADSAARQECEDEDAYEMRHEHPPALIGLPTLLRGANGKAARCHTPEPFGVLTIRQHVRHGRHAAKTFVKRNEFGNVRTVVWRLTCGMGARSFQRRLASRRTPLSARDLCRFTTCSRVRAFDRDRNAS